MIWNAAALWSVLMLGPVALHDGWPANHDSAAAVARMAAVVDQWKLGRVLPVWSTTQQFHHGSPLPALYHKTHMYASAAVLGVTGNVKAALVLPLFAFMVVGFVGMARCVGAVVRQRYVWLQWTAGAVFTASNYATTDWLVRGAFAEFTAMCLVPWLLLWCLRWIGTGHWERWIGALFALLALSHAPIALFGLLPLGIAAACAAVRWRGSARAWLGPAMQSAAMSLVLLVPFILPMLVFLRVSNVDRLRLFDILRNTQPVQQYFWDSTWLWGADWRGMTLQIDLLVLASVPLAAWFLVRACLGRPGGAGRWPLDRASTLFVIVSLAGFAVLLTKTAAPIYAVIPGGLNLQFAWRLLVYVTPLLLLVACLAIAGLHRWRPLPPLPSGAALATIATTLLLATTVQPKLAGYPLRYAWIPGAALTAERQDNSRYAAFGEFLPLVRWPETEGLLGPSTQAEAILSQPLDQPCKVLPDAKVASGEVRRRTWHVDCAQAADAVLPVFTTPGMRVRVWRGAASEPAVPSRTCGDPRLRVAVPAGVSDVQVEFPRWSRVVASLWERPAFDYRRDCPATS